MKKTLVLGLAMMLTICSFAVVLSTSAEAVVSVPAWQQRSPIPVATEQAAVISNASGIIFVIGGFTNASTTLAVNTTWSYDPATDHWKQLAPALEAVRGAAIALAPDGRIFVFGGVNSADTVVNTIQIYFPSNNTWMRPLIILYDAVWEAKAVYLPALNNFYIIGGTTTGVSPTTEVQWVPLSLGSVSKYIGGPGLLPSAREAGSLILSPNGSTLWYFGGIDAGGITSTSVLEFNPLAPSWTLVTSMPAGIAAQGVVRAADGLYYVYGGGPHILNSEPGVATGYYYNPYTHSWGTLPNLGQATKYLGAAATADGRILAIGGGNGTVLNNVQSLQVLSYTTTASSTAKTGEPFIARLSVQASFAQSIAYFTFDADIKGADGTTYSHVSVNSVTPDPIAFEMTVPQAAPSGSYSVRFYDLQVNYSGTNWLGLQARQVPLAVTALPPMSAQIAALDLQVISLEQNLSATQAQLGQTWATGNATAAQVTVLQTTIASLQVQLGDTQTSLARAQAAISSGDAAAQNSTNLTQAQITALQAQIVALQVQLNNSQTQLATLQASNGDLKDSVNTKADGTIAMITMVFALIAVVLIALMLLVMLRKK